MSTLALFDLDGTLVKGTDLHKKSFRAAIKKTYGIEASVNEIEHHGMVDKGIMLTLLARHGIPKEEALAKLDEAIAFMCTYYIDHADETHIRRLDGAQELVSALLELDVKPGLLTGNARDIAFEKMRLTGFQGVFRFGGFGDEAFERSDLVPLAISRAESLFKERYAKKDVFVIGDTPKDIEAARIAGVKSIAVATGKYPLSELRRHNPTYSVGTLKEKESILGWITHKA